MGTDIRCVAEKKVGSSWESVLDDLFEMYRDYHITAWLGDLHNYRHINPIVPLRDLPADRSDRFDCILHDSGSFAEGWVTVEELNQVDYDQPLEQHVSQNAVAYSKSYTEAPAGTLREYLGEYYFQELARLNASGAERILFFFY